MFPFNHYKLRKRLSRTVKTVKEEFVPADREPIQLKDASVGSRQKNPFIYTDPKAGRKKKWQMGIIVFSCVGTIGVALFHPFFHINHVSVSGTERLKAVDVEHAVLGTVQYRKYFVLPANNYFLLDVNEIKNVLLTRFPLANVTVKKEFPNSVTIQLSEKMSTIIYDNGKQYAYIGLDGKVVEVVRSVGADEWIHTTKTVTSTNEQNETTTEEQIISSTHIPRITALSKDLGNFPVVYDMRGTDEAVNSTVLEPETVQGIVTWFQYLQTAQMPLTYIVLTDEFGDAVIHTNTKMVLQVKIKERIEDQLDALKIVMAKNNLQPNTVSSIDVRFPSRVYWRD